MLASSGYVSRVNEDLCIGCSDCGPFCQFDALEVVDGVNTVSYEKCMGCGVCISKCDQEALTLVLDEAKGVPLEVCSLMGEAFLYAS
jgi:Pyruvate/2-oxoacid:ferredoxin oxidoreductase delta subunit